MTACVACGSTAAPYTAKNKFEVHRCSLCELTFIWPMPDNSLEIYEADYFSGASQGFGYTDYDRDKQPMVPTFETYLRRIAKHTAPGPRKTLMDVGAATGFFLNLARQAGWETAGIEPSESAASLGRAKGLDVKTGILVPGVYAAGSFDVITMWDVIEHLPDPKATMQLVIDLLKPGGVVAINTPDASSLWAKFMGPRWHLLCPPEHLCLFSPKSLGSLLRDQGMSVLEVSKIGKSFTLQYVVQTLAHWQKLRLWESLGERLQGSALGRVQIPINLYDNFFVLAQKPRN